MNTKYSSPQLSIIVAAYNVQSYIEQCLTSVLVNTPFTKEVIVINDGSTDQTLTIIKQMAECYPALVVIDQENTGVSVVRNRGIKEARGDYLFFVDGDDYVDLKQLELQALITLPEPLKQKEKQPDVIGLSHFEFFPNGNTQEQGIYLKKEYVLSWFTNGPYFLSRLLKTRIYSCGVPFYLWKRTFLIEQHLVFLPTIRYQEDVLFTFTALLQAQTAGYYNNSLYHYRRQRTGSATLSFNKQRLQAIATILPLMQQALQQHSTNKDYPVLSSNLASTAFELLHLIVLSKNKKEFLPLFKQLHLIDYIFIYSKIGKYWLAALFIKVFGLSAYCFCYSLVKK